MTGPPVGARHASPSLEDMLERLEKLLQRLADPAAPLERAVTDYEDASRLLAAAQERLDAAASRVAQAIPEP